MDGTLLRSDKTIHPDTLEDMKNAVCDGIIVSYCTGRAVPELLSDGKSFVRADQVSHMGDYNLQIYQSMFERVTTRLSSIDKAAGYALLNGIDMKKCMLFTSGRVPVDMVEKVIAAASLKIRAYIRVRKTGKKIRRIPYLPHP